MLFDPGERCYHPPTFGAVGDLAEAAVHSGRTGQARAVVAATPLLHAPGASAWIRAGMTLARPLLALDDEADGVFETSLSTDLTRWPVHRARLQLAHGVWLRRRRHVAASRAPLRAARDAFDVLGAVPWSEQARRELRASGEASRPRSSYDRERLTPQELQIAHLAAEGLSNREIGQQLFLSHRTVGSHLYRIFPKLGITSRGQLAKALDR